MSVKSEIEKQAILLNVARSLNYLRPGSTLADLKRELESALVFVNALAEKYGESAALNDKRRNPKVSPSAPQWVQKEGQPAPRTFIASTEGENRLELREVCQEYID